MSKFAVIKRLNLDHYGEGWEDCYLTFREPSVTESTPLEDLPSSEEMQKEPKLLHESVDRLTKVISDCFVDGKAFDGKEKFDVKVEDLKDLPVAVFEEVTYFLLRGRTSPVISQGSKKKQS